MKVENRKLDELIPYEKNAKKHDKTQISNVAESIRQYGFVQPIVVDRNSVIVIGHCRALAAQKLGMEEVPCVCVGELMLTAVDAMLTQKTTQKNKGGMSDVYNASGTYLKSFYSVMIMPSAVTVQEMGDKHRRIHHNVEWDYCVPKILNEKWKKGG